VRSKPWFMSKSLWGAVVVIVAAAAKVYGVDVGDEQGWLVDLMILNGGIFALYGRVKAVKKITFRREAK